MRFMDARMAVRSVLSTLVALSGCATPTKQPPLVPIVQMQLPTDTAGAIPSARRPVKARKPNLIATSQIQPCVFRGSLSFSGWLYSQAAGGKGIVEFAANGAVQIERLELPNTPDGRAKVVAASPIHIEAYIDARENNIVQIDKRVDIVPTHVWLDPGTLVHASLRTDDTAEIKKPFSHGTSPPEFVTSVPCADLSLQQGYTKKSSPAGDPVAVRPERIPIHESPGGREVAAIEGRAGFGSPSVFVWTIEKKPGWLHVEGNDEFHFQGWIPASSVSTEGYGMIGLLAGPGDVTHQVTKPIPLRIEATDAAPVIANATQGAEILIAPGPSGYRVIRFGVGVSTSFFAREVDLRGAVRLADDVEPGEPEWQDQQEQMASASCSDSDSASPVVPSTPMPPPAPILLPSIEKNWDLAEVTIHASLEEGARRIRQGDWAGASKALSTAVNGLSDGDFEARMVGYALLGRACDRKGDDTCAITAYTKVLELAKNSEAKIKALIALHGDAVTNMVARLLLAQGEALFYKAEQKRKAADAVQFPIYRGNGNRDDVLQHLSSKVIDWIKKKRILLEEAEQAYAEILKLDPAPPAWIVLAAGRSGDIWSAFVYEFQTFPPIPSEWNGPGTVPGSDLTYEELRREYRKKLEDGSAPQRQHAAAAYKSCRDHAKKHGVAVIEGKRCEERLVAMGATP